MPNTKMQNSQMSQKTNKPEVITHLGEGNLARFLAINITHICPVMM